LVHPSPPWGLYLQYPDKELHITACLFGGIIDRTLVTYLGECPPFIAAIFLSVYCAETKTSASYFCGDVIRAVTSEGGVVLCAAAVRNSKFNFRSVKEV